MRRAQDWCILRTSGPRTLKLAESLSEAGLDVWTPVAKIKHRKPGGRSGKVERTVPLTPTFVFARHAALSALLATIADPMSPHPRFSVFRYYGEIAFISNREIERLQEAERRAVPKAKRATFAPGTVVQPSEGPYTGISGFVRRSDGKYTLVAFGGWMDVQIETFTIRSADVRGETALVGIAA